MNSRDKIEVLSVHVARIDERVHSLVEDLRELKEAQRSHRDESVEALRCISEKIGDQNDAIKQYKNDRIWIIGVFGVLYSALLTWVKHKLNV